MTSHETNNVRLAIVSFCTLCWTGTAREDATDRLDNAVSLKNHDRKRKNMKTPFAAFAV
jgi:hypothetical protein